MLVRKIQKKIYNLAFFQTEFSDFVHYLGGSVRKDYSDQVTDVISHANIREKYLVNNRI